METNVVHRRSLAMSAERKQKLKVYRTPVGFHDAYVAAPSQKAALEAWGAKTNLFAQGSAHAVTEQALTKAPLQNPGQVIKVLRGSDADQLAALEQSASPTGRTAERRQPKPAKAMKPRGPKPSRTKLSKAEKAFEALQARHAKELRRLQEEERALDRKRADLERQQAREIGAANERIERERDQYDRSVRTWAKGGDPADTG